MDIFSGISWDTDVFPQLTDFLSQDVIKAPLIFIIVVVLGTFAASQVLRTWGK